MGTVIRAELSTKNKYWIDKHRYYELKHFCLQYKDWKKAYLACSDAVIFASHIERMPATNVPSDITAKYGIMKAHYDKKIKLIENAAIGADEFLAPYILKAVTEGLSYTYLKTSLDIPCGRDMYYDRYRKFFWILSNSRE